MRFSVRSVEGETRTIGRATPRFDPMPATRFGLISLASDAVASDEIRAILAGDGRAIHETRIENSDRIDRETLAAMEPRLTGAAGLLPMPEAYDSVGYLCTSAATEIGSERVAALINAAVPGAEITDPMRAALAACEHLSARRIGLVTPYVDAVTERIAARIEAAGIVVARASSFDVDQDSRVALIDAGAIGEAVATVAESADMVFVSCTALRTVKHIAGWEASCGLPVISSNQAVAWHMLRTGRLAPAPGQWGRLFGAVSR
ncbi:MAG: Asp/Glu racemase [Pseudomonadota bacterium]